MDKLLVQYAQLIETRNRAKAAGACDDAKFLSYFRALPGCEARPVLVIRGTEEFPAYLLQTVGHGSRRLLLPGTAWKLTYVKKSARVLLLGESRDDLREFRCLVELHDNRDKVLRGICKDTCRTKEKARLDTSKTNAGSKNIYSRSKLK